MKYKFKTFNGPSLIRLVFQFGSVITFIATVIYCHISTIPYSVSVFMIFFTALTVVISFLFAANIRLGDVDSFSQLGISHPLFFVLVAGIIELLGSLSLSCGILTRAGSILLFIYLVVTAFLGHHFSDGFIWASPGGGWEYPVLWSVLVLTFAFFAPYKFSVDQFLLNHYNLPQWLVYFIGKRRKTF